MAENVTVSLDDNGAFIITNDNPDYAKFQIMGMVYANAYLNGTPNGTMGITVSTGVNTADTINGNFRKLNIIDSTSSLIGSTVNESGYLNNPTISIDGTEYYYHDSTPKNGLQYIVGSSGANYVSTPTYRLYCYTDNDYLA